MNERSLGLARPVLAAPYPLSPAFAFYLAVRFCRSAEVYNAIAEHVQAECVPDPSARHLFVAALDVGRTFGRAPADIVVVLQRLERSVDNGDIRASEIEDVRARVLEFDTRLEEAMIRGDKPPSDAILVAEVTPMLQTRAHRQLLLDATQLLAANDSTGLAEIGKKMIDVVSIGALASDDDDGWEDAQTTIDSIQGLPRCPIGVEEIDIILRGGVHLGSYTTWAAGTGGSKSTAIAHACATALLRRKNVLLAVLEMPKWEAWAKIIANLTGVPLDAIRNSEAAGWGALASMRGKLGDLRIIKLEDPTPVSTIRAWRQRKQQQYGVPYDFVAVDGVDHLTSARHDPRNGSYELGRAVCAELDDFAVGGPHGDDPIYLHVTSHIQRGKQWSAKATDGTRVPGKDDLADSKHRANKTHYLITNTVVRDEGGAESIYIHLAKSRFSRADVVIGPVPCDLGTARLVKPYVPIPLASQGALPEVL